MPQQPRIRVVVQLPYNRPDNPLPDPPHVRIGSRSSLGFWLNELGPCRLNGTRRRLIYYGRLSRSLGRAIMVARIVSRLPVDIDSVI
jgi:hypothetical protein